MLAADRGDTLSIPLPAIARIEVGRGYHRRTAVGGGIGMALGMVAGGLMGYAQGDSPECEGPCSLLYDRETAELKAALGVVGGSVVGSLVGAIVGSRYRTERWERVPLRERARVGLVPCSDGGLQLSIAVSF
jgi:hypothetical protein